MSHARVEEVSDSDISDPEEMDVSELDPGQILRPANAAPASPMAAAAAGVPPAQGLRPQMRDTAEDARQRERFRRGVSIYPIFFDASRSKKEGRRVGKKYAIENPLAREIAEAAHGMGYQVALEASKMHPKDWANPGRVKVQFKQDGVLQNPEITNKHYLYIKIAEWLQAHPTNAQTPLKMPIHGLPMKVPDAPHVPKGRKMNTILPLHSPALSGGGVSENMFKDMLEGMQGMAPGGAVEPGSSGGPQKKKEKKNKK